MRITFETWLNLYNQGINWLKNPSDNSMDKALETQSHDWGPLFSQHMMECAAPRNCPLYTQDKLRVC